MVAYKLETDGVGNFCLTCKEITKKTHKWFGEKYCKTRQIMLSRYSVNILVEISKNLHGSHLWRLSNGTEHLGGIYFDMQKEVRNNEQKEAYENLFDEQQYSLHSGWFTAKLTTCFNNFASLRSLIFHVTDGVGPYNSYGARKIMQDTGLIK